tara:strand:+ start:426 stop:1631 length:1206 start_codon:yes stop_codon:yes gene_type:complete
MTRTITALTVLTIIATVGINSAYAIDGDGTSHVEVDEYPFNITILEGGSMTLHNNGEQTIDFVSYGWFEGTVPANDAIRISFPVVSCGTTCFVEGMYYISDLNGEQQSTITIVKPVPVYVEPIVVEESKVQGVASNVDVSTFPFEITILEEGTITITSDVDRVLRSDVSTIKVKAGEPFDLVLSPLLDSDNVDGWYVKDMATGEYSIIHTVTAPSVYVEPTPVYVEPTPEPVAENIFAVTDEGIYNVANYKGDVDLITMQIQLANVTAQFNNSITKLAQQKVAIENHSNQLQSLNTQIVTLNATANGVSTLEQTVLSLQLEKETLNARILTLGNTTTSQLATITQLNVQASDTSILDVKITNLEAQVVSLTSERDQWKQLANNWYAIAMEQLKVMVNFLGI